MALDITKLERVGGGGNGLFIYQAAADAIATVTASGFFNLATTMLKKGDVILVIGAAFTTIDSIFVSSTSGAAVVTTLATEGVTAT